MQVDVSSVKAFSVKGLQQSTIKDILKQLSKRCVVSVRRLSQREIDYHTKQKVDVVNNTEASKPCCTSDFRVKPTDESVVLEGSRVPIPLENKTVDVSNPVKRPYVRRKRGPNKKKTAKAPVNDNQIANVLRISNNLHDMINKISKEFDSESRKKRKKNQSPDGVKRQRKSEKHVENVSSVCCDSDNGCIVIDDSNSSGSNCSTGQAPHDPLSIRVMPPEKLFQQSTLTNPVIASVSSDKILDPIANRLVEKDITQKNCSENIVKATSRLNLPNSSINTQANSQQKFKSPNNPMSNKAVADLVLLMKLHFNKEVMDRVLVLSKIYVNCIDCLGKFDVDIRNLPVHEQKIQAQKYVIGLNHFVKSPHGSLFVKTFDEIIQSFGINLRWELIIILYCLIMCYVFKFRSFLPVSQFFKGKNLIRLILKDKNYSNDILTKLFSLSKDVFGDLVLTCCNAIKSFYPNLPPEANQLVSHVASERQISNANPSAPDLNFNRQHIVENQIASNTTNNMINKLPANNSADLNINIQLRHSVVSESGSSCCTASSNICNKDNCSVDLRYFSNDSQHSNNHMSSYVQPQTAISGNLAPVSSQHGVSLQQGARALPPPYPVDQTYSQNPLTANYGQPSHESVHPGLSYSGQSDNSIGKSYSNQNQNVSNSSAASHNFSQNPAISQNYTNHSVSNSAVAVNSNNVSYISGKDDIPYLEREIRNNLCNLYADKRFKNACAQQKNQLQQNNLMNSVKDLNVSNVKQSEINTISPVYQRNGPRGRKNAPRGRKTSLQARKGITIATANATQQDINSSKQLYSSDLSINRSVSEIAVVPQNFDYLHLNGEESVKRSQVMNSNNLRVSSSVRSDVLKTVTQSIRDRNSNVDQGGINNLAVPKTSSINANDSRVQNVGNNSTSSLTDINNMIQVTKVPQLPSSQTAVSDKPGNQAINSNAVCKLKIKDPKTLNESVGDVNLSLNLKNNFKTYGFYIVDDPVEEVADPLAMDIRNNTTNKDKVNNSSTLQSLLQNPIVTSNTDKNLVNGNVANLPRNNVTLHDVMNRIVEENFRIASSTSSVSLNNSVHSGTNNKSCIVNSPDKSTRDRTETQYELAKITLVPKSSSNSGCTTSTSVITTSSSVSQSAVVTNATSISSAVERSSAVDSNPENSVSHNQDISTSGTVNSSTFRMDDSNDVKCTVAKCNNVAAVVCSGCEKSVYCSSKCQESHWYAEHMKVCDMSLLSSEEIENLKVQI